MGVSIVDGTIEEAVLARSVRNIRIYRPIRFRRRDGGSQTLRKAVVRAELEPFLRPGVGGRFYLYSAVDQRGVHGVRDESGRAVFAFARNNEIAMLVLALVNLTWMVVGAALMEGVPLVGALLFLMAGGSFLYLYAVRLEAKRQFEQDSHHRPPVAADSVGGAAEPAAGNLL
jgi:hypothetical protein